MTLEMLIYDKRAEHNFLKEDLCRKLIDSGIDMSDASYCFVKIDGVVYVTTKENLELISTSNKIDGDPVPTYTLADMIYKMNEYPYVDEKCFGPLGFIKDAPFYCFTYHPSQKTENVPEYISSTAETPIEAAANMLMLSMKYKIRIIEDITPKYNEQ